VRTFFRKHLFPLIICSGILIYLGLWITTELLSSYKIKLREQHQTVLIINKALRMMVKTQLEKENTDYRELENIFKSLVDSTGLEFIKLEGGNKRLAGVNDRKKFNLDYSGSSGYFVREHTFIMWHQIQIPGSGGTPENYKLITGIDTRGHFKDVKPDVRLIFMIFIASFVAVALFFFYWSCLNSKKDVQERLKAALSNREHYEELSLAATGLAHETKNPLGIIRGLAQQIADSDDNPGNSRQMAKDIMEEADITTARLGDFLSYARLRSPELSGINAVEQINRIKNLIIEDFENSGIKLETQVEPLTILADAEMLSQILLNLLMNSLKFTEKGCHAAIILRKTTRDNAELIVEDSGSGIPADVLPGVFKPYISKRADGYGIGLAIVKRIVEQSGWRIHIESTAGKGTKVIINDIKTLSGEN
jgi:signal transduction histidine kinase